MAYRPTSLDFINRPNPVEPHTDPHKHPLHSQQSHLRLLHHGNAAAPNVVSGEPPRKRRKSADGPSSELERPTLPAVRAQGEKRPRIPPTLSGLHQPPPDAGILPSISVDGPRSTELPERTVTSTSQAKTSQEPALESDKPSTSPKRPSASDKSLKGVTEEGGSLSICDRPARSRKNKKWTESETKDLLRGVEKYGIGRWTKIMNDPEFEFDERRTALDLKDRFRVCCPDHYKTTKRPKSLKTPQNNDSSQTRDESLEQTKHKRRTHRKTQAELRDLGIKEGFARSGRRKRTAYTEAEDQAILEGFRVHGKKWLSIQQDEDLGLGARRPMDLRDRVRTRWPEEYASAGLKLRAGRHADQAYSTGKSETTYMESMARKKISNDVAASKGTQTDKIVDARPQPQNKEPPELPVAIRKAAAPAFLDQADDVFWSMPLDVEEERVTLDRRILDWPLHSSRNQAPSTIDPISTLNLPRPNAIAEMSTGNVFSTGGSSAVALPSLAAVTATSLPFDFGDQLELPSLLEGFGALEDANNETRAGTQLMPSLDEILG